MDKLVHALERQGIVVTADEMPDISPDFGFPGGTLLNQIASWILGGGLVLAFIALIVLVLLIVFKGFGNQGAQQKASGLAVPVFLGLVVLGSITAVYHFIIGLDLGL
ncbi:hypothetical protein JSO19_03880 [Leucobacter sp. UCMA 4100]|uniref:hypothetical protein n=1 Tax=Leucobacter sp. UCMA 4100 TaxID=2810534 RepID=UPI0022EAC393|nr:hypothetical protein [Leucobacter sp. UCMA 4100]MDA3146515.1 hypothetical protein [Leucobacter sp. UCMA 4100]